MPSPRGSPRHSPRRPAGASPRDDDSKQSPPKEPKEKGSPHASPRDGSPRLQKKGHHHAGLLEDDDEENSLDSEHDRKQKAEEAANERREAWRRRREMCRYLCRSIVHACCHKRRLRKQTFKYNTWVNVGDRYERQVELKAKREAAFEREQSAFEQNRKKQASRIRKCVNAVSLLCKTMSQDVAVFLKESLGYVDKRTGLPKELLESWTFRQRLHENKHGYVFEAMDADGTLVAVKIRDKSRGNVLLLPLRQAANALWRVGAIRRKGKLHALLVKLHLVRPFEHDHLATLYAVFENPEFYVEVCELMLGPCLATHLEDMEMQLDESRTCQIFTQVVTALLYLHSRRVIFRDLRLSQIFLTKPPEAETEEHQEHSEMLVKLTDFWCVARTKKKHGSMFQPFYPGDIATLSPEVLQYGEWTDKADVWAAGCLLFELLFGHPPYGGEGHALALRIMRHEPEYDMVCGKLSDSALTLLKAMLSRRHYHRPTMRDVLSYRWFNEFGYVDKGRPDGRTAHKIKSVRIEAAPLYRRGMPPENLLVAQTGMFNAGFCSFMGATSCHIDFEVGGPEDWRLYWVCSIRVALWGNGDNPRKVAFSMAVRAGGLYNIVHRVDVAGMSQTEVEYTPNRPIRHLRVAFRDNFQGDFGIAIRKIGLTGFEVRPIPVIIDLDAAVFNNCEIWLHSEETTDQDVNHGRVHWSLKPALEKGLRIPGTGSRYWKYRDVYSGSECGITVLGILLQPEPGYTIVAADLGLRFCAHAPLMATPPRIRITVESAQNGKEVLFKTADLPDTAWPLKDIMSNGYEELPLLHAAHLDIPTDETLLVEIHFELNSGYLNIPTDFGLTFYYMPDVATPASEEDHEAPDKDELIARRGSSLTDLGSKGRKSQEVGDAEEEERPGVAKQVDVYDVEMVQFEAEQDEATLLKDLRELQFQAKFGVWGTGNFDKHECRPLEVWNVPEDLDDIEEGPTDLQQKKMWWEGSWTDDHVSSEFRSQDGTPRLKELEPGLYVASDTTCPHTTATHLRTNSGIETRTGSRHSLAHDYGDLRRQSSPTLSSPREKKLDAWGAIDEWEPTREWARSEHQGRTDAWGVPLDDRAAVEYDRAEQERTRIRKMAGDVVGAVRQKTRASAEMQLAKLHSSPLGKRVQAMEELAHQKFQELESSFAGVCKTICPD